MDCLEKDICGLRDDGLPIVALGEIGLDFHYSADTAKSQVELFEAELSLSRKLRMPVVVHSREATDETLESLSSHAAQWKGPTDCIGVLHCFTGDVPFARRLLDLGFHISFSGIVTFNKAGSLREVVPVVPDDRLLIETDTPYLAPVPHRGKRNEPAYVVDVAARVAELRGCSLEEVGELTAANAKRLFPGQGDNVLS
jgi:TatD DNase family protein